MAKVIKYDPTLPTLNADDSYQKRSRIPRLLELRQGEIITGMNELLCELFAAGWEDDAARNAALAKIKKLLGDASIIVDFPDGNATKDVWEMWGTATLTYLADNIIVADGRQYWLDDAPRFEETPLRSLIYQPEERQMNATADHTIVYLVRHGEALDDELELFGGWTESELTPQGEKAIKEAAAFIGQYKFGPVYVDDLVRTQESAKIILPYSQTATELIVNEKARAWGTGHLAGRPKNAANEKIKDYYVANPDVVPEGSGAESLNQFRRRWLSFLAYVISRTPASMPSVIVCHSGNIKTTTDTFGIKIRVKPSGIVALHIAEQGIKMEVLRPGVLTRLRADQDERCYGDFGQEYR